MNVDFTGLHIAADRKTVTGLNRLVSADRKLFEQSFENINNELKNKDLYLSIEDIQPKRSNQKAYKYNFVFSDAHKNPIAETTIYEPDLDSKKEILHSKDAYENSVLNLKNVVQSAFSRRENYQPAGSILNKYI